MNIEIFNVISIFYAIVTAVLLSMFFSSKKDGSQLGQAMFGIGSVVAVVFWVSSVIYILYMYS